MSTDQIPLPLFPIQLPDGTGKAGMHRYYAAQCRLSLERAIREGKVTFAHYLEAATADVLEEDDPEKLKVLLNRVGIITAAWQCSR